MSDSSIFELRKFVAPEIIIGLDARLLIGRYLGHFEAKRPLIVTDRQIRRQPWFQDVLAEIASLSIDPVIFDDVTPNPKDYEAMAGARLFLSEHCDLIVAIGGGSPMDCAKCISIVSANGGNIMDYIGVDEVVLPGPPLICVPSTAGTSADVSQFAVIYDSQERFKKLIVSKKIVPDLALIDPEPLMTMDPFLTACTGMDALTHAIEAYVSNAQSALTDVHALEAIRIISASLVAACSDNRSMESLYQMMLGSIQAGLAFSNASLGATHAMAHGLGGVFDLPHGECNSILLEHIVRLNFEAVPDRFRVIAREMGLAIGSEPDERVKELLLKRISDLREAIGIKSFIMIHELSDAMIDSLVDASFNDPCMVTNPRQLSKQEVKAIYERVLRIEE